MPHFKARLAVIILIYNCIRPHNTLSKNPDKTRTPRTPALVAKWYLVSNRGGLSQEMMTESYTTRFWIEEGGRYSNGSQQVV